MFGRRTRSGIARTCCTRIVLLILILLLRRRRCAKGRTFSMKIETKKRMVDVAKVDSRRERGARRGRGRNREGECVRARGRGRSPKGFGFVRPLLS